MPSAALRSATRSASLTARSRSFTFFACSARSRFTYKGAHLRSRVPHVPLPVCLAACVSVCLPACLPACPSVSLSACLSPVCLLVSVSFSVPVPVCPSACLCLRLRLPLGFWSACVPARLRVSVTVSLSVPCLFACLCLRLRLGSGLSVCPSACLSASGSVSVCLSASLSVSGSVPVCLSVSVSVCVSVSAFLCLRLSVSALSVRRPPCTQAALLTSPHTKKTSDDPRGLRFAHPCFHLGCLQPLLVPQCHSPHTVPAQPALVCRRPPTHEAR